MPRTRSPKKNPSSSYGATELTGLPMIPDDQSDPDADISTSSEGVKQAFKLLDLCSDDLHTVKEVLAGQGIALTGPTAGQRPRGGRYAVDTSDVLKSAFHAKRYSAALSINQSYLLHVKEGIFEVNEAPSVEQLLIQLSDPLQSAKKGKEREGTVQTSALRDFFDTIYPDGIDKDQNEIIFQIENSVMTLDEVLDQTDLPGSAEFQNTLYAMVPIEEFSQFRPPGTAVGSRERIKSEESLGKISRMLARKVTLETQLLDKVRHRYWERSKQSSTAST